MARQKSYDLNDAEQRDLVTLIQQGKALPEKYRFILFEDKREVELRLERKDARRVHYSAAFPNAGARG